MGPFSCNIASNEYPNMTINNTRLFYSLIVAVSLHLVLIGIRIPSILGAHSTNPHSHVVIETSVKDSQAEGPRKNLVDVVCQNFIKIVIPTHFNLPAQLENQKHRFIPHGHFHARAPPAFIA